MKRNALSTIVGFFTALMLMVSCSKDPVSEVINEPNNLQGSFLKAAKNEFNLTPKERLGKELYFDKISVPNNMGCFTCHDPIAGFSGPNPGINLVYGIYPGAVSTRFGNRKPPTSSYATFSPVFHYDATEELFVGGNFWDGRATGEKLGNPAADQAQGPFLNPVEHNVANAHDVLEMISDAKYIYLWEQVWGEPLAFSTEEEITKNYDRVGLAIAAFEASPEVNQFSSKFDYYLKGLVQLTPDELWGMDLFNSEDKGKCALCHISDGTQPLFTDFTYDNLGVPKNPDNPFYMVDPDFIDPGLGGFLASRPEWASMASENMGKHKVPTLRNVGKAPAPGFIKAYMHNGVFKSLKEVVHFYNTRDVEVWPAPEVAETVNFDELGNLGLTDAEEDAIVAFMLTLSDGYKLPK